MRRISKSVLLKAKNHYLIFFLHRYINSIYDTQIKEIKETKV